MKSSALASLSAPPLVAPWVVAWATDWLPFLLNRLPLQVAPTRSRLWWIARDARTATTGTVPTNTQQATTTTTIASLVTTTTRTVTTTAITTTIPTPPQAATTAAAESRGLAAATRTAHRATKCRGVVSKKRIYNGRFMLLIRFYLHCINISFSISTPAVVAPFSDSTPIYPLYKI